MQITDDYMRQMLTKTKDYTLVILKASEKENDSKRNDSEVEKVIWEHARRNFSLREEGKLSIVCPVNDRTKVKGIGVFNTSEKETKIIMDEDPAVKAGIFSYEIHPCRSFPGDILPEE